VVTLGCWWQNFDIGNMFWMLVPDAYVRRFRHLKNVINTFRLQHPLPTWMNIEFCNWFFQLIWFAVEKSESRFIESDWLMIPDQPKRELFYIFWQMKKGLIPNVPIIRLCLTDRPPCTGQSTGFYAGQILWGLLSVPWWLWFGRQKVFFYFFRPYYPKVTSLVFWRCEKSALVAKTERWPDDPPFEVTQTHRMFCFSQFKKILRPVDLACIGLPRKINSLNLTVQDQRWNKAFMLI